jgi:hypothetical protein
MNRITLTNLQKEQLEREGFLILEDVVSQQNLKGGREDFNTIVNKVKSRKYDFVRDDHLLSGDGFYGIEYPFHPEIFSKNIFKAVVESNILDFCNSALNTNDTFLAINRYHTSFEYTWSGFWHRDDIITSNDHVQVIFPFYDELGLHVVPGSHVKVVEGFSPGVKTRKTFPGEVVVNLKASNVLLFKSSILHRGTCVGGFNGLKRAHMHLRVARMEYLPTFKRFDESSFWNREEVLNIADDSWRSILTKELPQTLEFSPLIKGKLRKEIFYRIKSTINKLLHWLLSPLSEQNPIFQRFSFLRPSLSKRKTLKKYKIFPSPE